MLFCDAIRSSVLILRALKLVEKEGRATFKYSGPPVYEEYLESQFQKYSRGHQLKKFNLVVPSCKIPDDWKPRHHRNLDGYGSKDRSHARCLQEKARMAQEMVFQGFQIDEQQQRSIANAKKVCCC